MAHIEKARLKIVTWLSFQRKIGSEQFCSTLLIAIGYNVPIACAYSPRTPSKSCSGTEGTNKKCTRVADRAFPQIKASWRQPGDIGRSANESAL